MKIEFAFRTYNSFGPNATLVLVGRWVESRIKTNYGGEIETVLIEACCKNTSPPKKTLEKMHSNFDSWLSKLPQYEITEKGTELRISYNAISYTYDEVRRDSAELSVKTFGQVLGKAIQLLESAPEEIGDMKGFDALSLSNDLKSLKEEIPKNLDGLVELYLQFK